MLPLITTPYLTRVLGSENLGTFSFNYTVAQYFSLFILLGLNNYGNRMVASCRDNKEELSKNFINIYSMQLICGGAISVLYFIYSIFISKDTSISLVFTIYILGSVIDINWFFFGLEKFKLTVLRNTIIKAMLTIAIFVFVKEENDIVIYCLIMALSSFISQVILWGYIRDEIHYVKPKIGEICKHVKPNLTLFVTVILVSLFKLMDKVMLGVLSERSESGFYEAAEKIISVPTSLVVALGTVMLPRTTNLLATGKTEKAEKYIYISIIFSAFVSTSMCFGLMGVSKEFVPLYYGSGYEKCIILYLILLPTCLFLSFGNVIRTQYLLPNSMDRPYVISAALGAGINLFLNACFIPLLGATGAAIGTLFAEISVCMYQSYAVSKKLPIRKYIVHSMPFFITGIVMFGLLFSLHLPITPVLIKLIVKVLIGAVVYMATILILYIVIRNIMKFQWFDLKEFISTILK